MGIDIIKNWEDFYPRPPRGGRLVVLVAVCTLWGFLSTPSARRATSTVRRRIKLLELFLSTPSARRATICRGKSRCGQGFLSTPSARRATDADHLAALVHIISIHALREEGDFGFPLGVQFPADFYPRPPRGGRPQVNCTPAPYWLDFYPRPPRGGRPKAGRNISIHALREEGDDFQSNTDSCQRISIHALREEGDAAPDSACPTGFDFYPRPPRGGRLFDDVDTHCDECISIHALREEGDREWSDERGHPTVFLSTPSARRAT